MLSVMARGQFLAYPTCSGKSIDQQALPVNAFFLSKAFYARTGLKAKSLGILLTIETQSW